MQYQRAEEILNSPENIEVLYNKEQIWIHNLNPGNKTAKISFLDSPEEKKQVPVNELKEGNERGLQ